MEIGSSAFDQRDLEIKTDAEDGTWQADVHVVEPLGDRNIFDVKVGNQTLRVKAPATLNTEPGTPVWIRVNHERIHLFDPKTERALA